MAAASSASLTRDAASDDAPNSLPTNSYAFLKRARSLDIEQADLQAHHEQANLQAHHECPPLYDDDELMTKLATFPNLDNTW